MRRSSIEFLALQDLSVCNECILIKDSNGHEADVSVASGYHLLAGRGLASTFYTLIPRISGRKYLVSITEPVPGAEGAALVKGGVLLTAEEVLLSASFCNYILNRIVSAEWISKQTETPSRAKQPHPTSIHRMPLRRGVCSTTPAAGDQ